MGEQIMSINSDVVGAAINQLSVWTADIQTRTKKFIELLAEKNQITGNKFALLSTLEKKIVVEANNFDRLIEAQEEIRQALNRYTELAAETNDDSAFNRD